MFHILLFQGELSDVLIIEQIRLFRPNLMLNQTIYIDFDKCTNEWPVIISNFVIRM